VEDAICHLAAAHCRCRPGAAHQCSLPGRRSRARRRPRLAVSRVTRQLALVPIVAMAAYALGLRVDQHGWTTDRIIAAACTLIAACYALGYTWAALSRGRWLKRLERCNLVTAFVILGVLVALFTPIADPARLSVASQLAQLQSGKVTIDKFDFAYLRFQGARYGKHALEALKAQTQGADGDLVRRRIDQVLAMKHPWEGSPTLARTVAELTANIAVYPEGRVLPAGFMERNWSVEPEHWSLPRCLTNRGVKCEAYLLDLKGDGNESGLEWVGVCGRAIGLLAADRHPRQAHPVCRYTDRVAPR